jgi:hypothetical protein
VAQLLVVRPLEDYGHCFVFFASDVGDHSSCQHDLSHSRRSPEASFIRHDVCVGLLRSVGVGICCELHFTGYLVAWGQECAGALVGHAGFFDRDVRLASIVRCGVLPETEQER